MDISRRGIFGGLAGLTALLAASACFAHHSFAAYESVKTVSLQGTVETFSWANPHTELKILVREHGADRQVEWRIESSAPGILRGFGWTGASLKRGDRVVAVVYPMRDRSPQGRLNTLTLPDTGQVLRTKLSPPVQGASI